MMSFFFIDMYVFITSKSMLYIAMAAIAIMVIDSGRWSDENCYVDYILEGIIFKENATFMELCTLMHAN